MRIRPVLIIATKLFLNRLLLLVLCVLCVGVLFTYATRDQSVIHVSVGKLLNLDNVHSVQIVEGMGNNRSPLFQVTDKKGEYVIKKVVTWMNTASIMNDSTLQASIRSYPPPTLFIYDNLGEKGLYVKVQPAFKTITGENGGVSTAPAKNELIVGNGKAGYFIYSPELYSWFDGGWTKDR